MKLTLQAARVYGANTYYGSSPIDNPITLRDVPREGEQFWVLLGSAPEPILRAYAVRRSVGAMKLNWVLRGVEPLSPEEFEQDLDEFVGELKGRNSWFVTIGVERETEVDDNLLSDAEYLWIDAEEARRLEDEFLPHASAFFDLVATYASTVLDSALFEKVEVHDRVYFSASGREPTSVPRSSTSARLTVPKNADTLDLGRLDQLLEAVSIAGRDTNVADALAYFRRDINWAFDLYNVFELIRKDVGGQRALEAVEWVSEAELTRFTQTTNQLRHAVPKGDPPRRPMNEGEAVQFISAMLEAWIRSKSE